MPVRPHDRAADESGVVGQEDTRTYVLRNASVFSRSGTSFAAVAQNDAPSSRAYNGAGGKGDTGPARSSAPPRSAAPGAEVDHGADVRAGRTGGHPASARAEQAPGRPRHGP